MISREFQEDLRNGMSISDACQKHKVSFKRAFEILQYKDVKRCDGNPGGNTGEAYIRYIKPCKNYQLNKTINGKFTYFGTYDCLSDAVKVRDYMIMHGWDKQNLDVIRCELGV